MAVGWGNVNAIDEVFSILETFLGDTGEFKVVRHRQEDRPQHQHHPRHRIRTRRQGLSCPEGDEVESTCLELKFLQFADAVSRNRSIQSVALPVMKKLLADVDENVVLMVRDGPDAVVAVGVEADHLLTVSGKWQSRVPFHAAAGGKMLAAHLPPGQWETMRSSTKLERLTENTIVDWNVLEEHLEKARHAWRSAR